MKKQLETFLRYLELETPIRFNFSAFVGPSKIVDPIDGPMIWNMVSINDGIIALRILNYNKKENRKIKRVEVFCGNESYYTSALIMKKQIESVLPFIPIEITTFEDLKKYL